ncbi:MAG: aminoglycoside phosphotransferase family protein [Patescibacteria group bacterium]|nr:aminoglycoside phosphotransferase family protein [Patescibacteria group bacterium]
MDEIIQKIIKKELGEDALKIIRMTMGICNEVYQVDLSSKKVIIRLNKDASKMSGSQQHLELFHSLGIKVQEIIAFDYSKTSTPYAYQIRSYLEGEDLDRVIADLSEKELKGIAEEISRIIKKLKPLPTNGKYGWVGENEDNLYDSWVQIIEKMIREVNERNEKHGVVGEEYIELMQNLLGKHLHYFKNMPSTFYYDDMSSKNVLIHEGRFAGLVDLDEIAYGDPLEGVGRILASWYGTAYGKVYSEAVMDSLDLDDKEREMVKVYALLNRIFWLSESGVEFNQNTSSEIDWENVKDNRRIIDDIKESLAV